MPFERFEQLDDPAFFADLIKEHFETGWKRVAQEVPAPPLAPPPPQPSRPDDLPDPARLERIMGST